MCDVIPERFHNVLNVSHHTFNSSLAGDHAVETLFTHTNVLDDTSENLSSVPTGIVWRIRWPQ